MSVSCFTQYHVAKAFLCNFGFLLHHFYTTTTLKYVELYGDM